jgi:hypothetical protein
MSYPVASLAVLASRTFSKFRINPPKRHLLSDRPGKVQFRSILPKDYGAAVVRDTKLTLRCDRSKIMAIATEGEEKG